MSFEEFVNTRPDLRCLFFGGKGGVGKTIVAAGAAYYLAEHLGKKTLISSMNPIHSLSNTFDQEILNRGICKVKDTERLYAVEADTSYATERYRQNVRERICEYINESKVPFIPEFFSDVDRSINQFVNVLTTNPAFNESLIFDDAIRAIVEGEFDCYVIDTAPVAFTIRLFKLSKAYDLWLDKVLRQREEMLSNAQTALKMKASQTEQIVNKLERDPLVMGLLSTRERTEEGSRVLKDRDKTAFFFVTLPLALPIAVVEKFTRWIQDLSIPIGGVIVNKLMPKQFDSVDVPSYVLNQIREQEHYLDIIHKKFSGLIRAFIPLYDTDVFGVGMVAKVAEVLSKSG